MMFNKQQEAISGVFHWLWLSLSKILCSWATKTVVLCNSCGSGHVTKISNLICWWVFFVVQKWKAIRTTKNSHIDGMQISVTVLTDALTDVCSKKTFHCTIFFSLAWRDVSFDVNTCLHIATSGKPDLHKYSTHTLGWKAWESERKGKNQWCSSEGTHCNAVWGSYVDM